MPGQWQARSTQALEAKDWSYEFGVTIGAARGNLEGIDVSTEEGKKEAMKALFEEFSFMLDAKSHPNFINRFNRYWRQRPRLGQAPASNPNIIEVRD